MRDGEGAIRVALAFAALLASLSLVISRQSRAMAELRALDAVRSARAVAESDRSQLSGRVQMLESRSRILEVAGQRLGMRVPAAGWEIVVLLRNLEAVDSMGADGTRDASARAVAAAAAPATRCATDACLAGGLQ